MYSAARIANPYDLTVRLIVETINIPFGLSNDFAACRREDGLGTCSIISSAVMISNSSCCSDDDDDDEEEEEEEEASIVLLAADDIDACCNSFSYSVNQLDANSSTVIPPIYRISRDDDNDDDDLTKRLFS